MPINSSMGTGPLSGLDAELARQPIDPGVNGLQIGASVGGSSQGPTAAPSPLEGMGPFLEDDPSVVFKAVHQLVLRQEPLAKNRLASDTYWTHVKRGHGMYYRLEKVPDQDAFKCVIAPGTARVIRPAAPNKAADLCQKDVASLLTDLPAPEPEAETDDETAERAADLAGRFLVQDGGEKGTRDSQLFERGLLSATHRATTFWHYWVDASGNGSVPLQIKAHPQAQDVQNPLVDPMGQPTTDYVLRYVTPDQQFTEDASAADRQWLPKICIDTLHREHVRCYPESKGAADAEMVIILHHCTLSEAKRRWPDTVGQMEGSELGQLCDWTPPRHLVLLPPAMRSRWKLANGDALDPKGSSNDERTMFYYGVYRRATPDYPRGCKLFLSGANQGTALGRDTLSADVPMPTGGTDIRCLDIPLVQLTLVQDDEDQDPTGKPLIAQFGPSALAAEGLITSYAEAMDKTLNRASFIPVTSPLTDDDIAESRATGGPAKVLSKDDYPQYEEAPALPNSLLGFIEMLDERQNAIANASRPAQGADNQQEVSGVARQIAVTQSNVGLSPMLQNFLSAVERHWRIKLEMAIASFTVPQMIQYEGQDGASTQEWFSGHDFAQVTGVKVKAGTGTMLPPEQKVDYVQKVQSMGYLAPEVAQTIARSTFAKTLGVPPDPQMQRVERQVTMWEKGPPSPAWVQQAQAYEQAKQLADQQTAEQTAQYQQDVAQRTQAHQQETNNAAASDKVAPGIQAAPAAPVLPPPPAPVQPVDPTTGQPMSPPWTPFGPLPMDDEPLIAGLRQARLRDVMAQSRFSAQPPEWQNVLVVEYNRMRQAVAASQAPPPLPKGVSIATTADASTVAQAEQAATHPQPAKAA